MIFSACMAKYYYRWKTNKKKSSNLKVLFKFHLTIEWIKTFPTNEHQIRFGRFSLFWFVISFLFLFVFFRLYIQSSYTCFWTTNFGMIWIVRSWFCFLLLLLLLSLSSKSASISGEAKQQMFGGGEKGEETYQHKWIIFF